MLSGSRFGPWATLVVSLSIASPLRADDAAEVVQAGVVTGFPDWVTAVAFSSDGGALAAGTYDEVRLIDPATQLVKGAIKTRNGYVRGLAYSSDGMRLVVGDYQSASIWDAASGKRVRRLSGHTGYVTAVAVAGDLVVTGSEDGTVRVWEAGSGQLRRTITVGVPVQDVAVSPDGTLLATAAGDPTRPTRPGAVALWSLETGGKVADLVEHERAALAVAFSPDGSRVASAGEDEKVNLHDVATRKAIGYYAGHSRSVNDVAFLAGGDVLASVSGGNAGGLCELRLWRLDGSELAAVEPHEQRIVCLAVSPDGRTLAVGSQDKTVSFWNVVPVVEAASKAMPRSPVEAKRP